MDAVGSLTAPRHLYQSTGMRRVGQCEVSGQPLLLAALHQHAQNLKLTRDYPQLQLQLQPNTAQAHNH
jgi:hypothetical protein